MIFLPSLVEDTAAHNQLPTAEPSRQSLYGPKTCVLRSQDRPAAPQLPWIDTTTTTLAPTRQGVDARKSGELR
jgi:hypothetical protein